MGNFFFLVRELGRALPFLKANERAGVLGRPSCWVFLGGWRVVVVVFFFFSRVSVSMILVNFSRVKSGGETNGVYISKIPGWWNSSGARPVRRMSIEEKSKGVTSLGIQRR